MRSVVGGISAEGEEVISSVCEGLGSSVPSCSAEAEGGAVVGSAVVVLGDGFCEGAVVAVTAGLLQPAAKQSAVRIKAAINFFMGMSFPWIKHIFSAISMPFFPLKVKTEKLKSGTIKLQLSLFFYKAIGYDKIMRNKQK